MTIHIQMLQDIAAHTCAMADSIRASINIYPFNANGNRGIAAGLSNIQFWEDGEPLNGRVRAEDEFDALDDDDADDFLD